MFLQAIDIPKNSRADARLFLFPPIRLTLMENGERIEPLIDSRVVVHPQPTPWNNEGGLIPLIYQSDMVVDGATGVTTNYFYT